MQKTPLMLKVEKRFERDIKNILEEKYVNKFELPYKIAVELKVNCQTIYRWLDILEIGRRNNCEAQLARRGIIRPDSFELRSLHYDDGMRLYQIAKKIGVNNATMYKWFSEDKIEVKRGGDYPLPSWPSKEKFDKLYHGNHMPLWRVAEKTGFCTNTIREIFNFYKIERRNQSEAMLTKCAMKLSKEELDFEYSILKKSPKELARKYHVWDKTIHRWLRGFSIKVRSPSESRLLFNAVKPNRDRMLEFYVEHGIAGAARLCGTTDKTFKRWLKKEGFLVSENGFFDREKRQRILKQVMAKRGKTLEDLTAYDFFNFGDNDSIGILNWYSGKYRTAPSNAIDYLINEYQFGKF